MKITFKPNNGPTVKCTLPYPHAQSVDAPNDVTCEHCGHADTMLIGEHPHTDRDTITSAVPCLYCGKLLGHLKVRMDTIFGIQEDENILNGPWKVY